MTAVKRLLLLLTLLLAACRPQAAATPESRLMLAVTGSLDMQADTRARLPDRLRRVTVWQSRVPVAAQVMQVTYDQDQRQQAWRVDLAGSQDSVQALIGGRTAALGQWQGRPLSLVVDGPLKGSLLAVSGPDLTLMSAAYAAHYERQAAQLAEGRP